MKHKVREIEGALLDQAVALADGWRQEVEPWQHYVRTAFSGQPSSEWNAGGPLIERERVMLNSYVGSWSAFAIGPERICERLRDGDVRGPTPLVAAMRAYVIAKLGEEIELPAV